mmetsp:Transcript_89237/g.178346  ORF Transcript_89237/g.178346 Transcript_89237/m.178346 type:complete len:211 (-) Transcript_89237:184-816(-)
MPCTRQMTTAMTTARAIMMLTTFKTSRSKTLTLAAWRSLAISEKPLPISVREPVSTTRQYASPALTVQPDRMASPCWGDGYFRGIGSPVSAAVSMESTSPFSHRTSAGTRLPPTKRMTSPGTSSVTGIILLLSSRFVETVDTIPAVSFASSPLAFSCSFIPRHALMTNIKKMTPKSTQSWTTAETMIQTSRIKGIVPTNCSAKRWRTVFW